jgi:hypothetical protein
MIIASAPEPTIVIKPQPKACIECREETPLFLVPDPEMTRNSAGRVRFVRADLYCPSCLLDRATPDRRESVEEIIELGWHTYRRAGLAAGIRLSAIYLWRFMAIDQFALNGLFVPVAGRPQLPVPWFGLVDGTLIAASMQVMLSKIPTLMLDANYMSGGRWPKVQFVGGSDKFRDYEELTKGVRVLREFEHANSGRKRAVSRERFAAEAPRIHHELSADYSNVTLEMMGEKFDGVSGKTISAYIEQYRKDGHHWPPHPED